MQDFFEKDDHSNEKYDIAKEKDTFDEGEGDRDDGEDKAFEIYNQNNPSDAELFAKLYKTKTSIF